MSSQFGNPMLINQNVIPNNADSGFFDSEGLDSGDLASNTLQTESMLMKDFLRSLRTDSRSSRLPSQILIPEFDGVLGRPDLVDARIRALPHSVALDALADSLSSPTNARIVASLKYRASRSCTHLQRVTGLSNRSLSQHLRQLEAAGIVEANTKATFSLKCRIPWSMVEIVAYEGKLSNWRRALHQAIGYRSFSHSVRVIMPVLAAHRAKKLENVFRINGIGLIAVENDGRNSILIHSRKRRPASRKLYLMAVGTVIRHFVNERRRLHRRIRPESIQCI